MNFSCLAVLICTKGTGGNQSFSTGFFLCLWHFGDKEAIVRGVVRDGDPATFLMLAEQPPLFFILDTGVPRVNDKTDCKFTETNSLSQRDRTFVKKKSEVGTVIQGFNKMQEAQVRVVVTPRVLQR